MVRAILDGTKSQTRRIVKPQPYEAATVPGIWTHEDLNADFGQSDFGSCFQKLAKKPYAEKGDRIWVRETWQRVWECEYCECWNWCYHRKNPGQDPPPGEHGECPCSRIVYRATEPNGIEDYCKPHPIDPIEVVPLGWRPSIFMFRWASRINLEITDVRVEQLQSITEEDARAEGMRYEHERLYCAHGHRSEFERLWDQINGDRAPWAENPWVWVLEFKRA